jgi:hypothetical protein
MVMRGLRLLATSSFLVIAASSARGQQDQIPKELALALIPFGANEGGEIVVGKLPPDLAGAITLPPGGRVLGSFMSLGYGQAVLTLPFAADSARGFVRQSLIEHGWVAREPMIPRMGGLQYGARGTQPTVFCKAGTPEGINVTSQFYGRETLIRLTRNTGMSACDPETTRGVTTSSVALVASSTFAGREAFMPLTTLPPLWSPGDPMSSMRVCRPSTNYGGPPYQSQEQSLRTALSAQDILAFYGKQLDSAGWKTAAMPDEMVTRTWTKSTAADSSQDVTLTVSRLPTTGCYQIELRATARGPKR